MLLFTVKGYESPVYLHNKMLSSHQLQDLPQKGWRVINVTGILFYWTQSEEKHILINTSLAFPLVSFQI